MNRSGINYNKKIIPKDQPNISHNHLLLVFKNIMEIPINRYSIKTQLNPEQFIGLDTKTQKTVLINYRTILPENFEDRVNDYKNYSIFRTINSPNILVPENVYIQKGFINHLVIIYEYYNGSSLEKIRDIDAVYGSEYFWPIARCILDASIDLVRSGYIVNIDTKDIFISDNKAWIISGKFSSYDNKNSKNVLDSVEEVCRKLRNYKRVRYTPPSKIIGYDDLGESKIIEQFLDSLGKINII